MLVQLGPNDSHKISKTIHYYSLNIWVSFVGTLSNGITILQHYSTVWLWIVKYMLTTYTVTQ